MLTYIIWVGLSETGRQKRKNPGNDSMRTQPNGTGFEDGEEGMSQRE